MLRNIISLYLFIAVILTLFFASYIFSKSRSSFAKVFSVLSFCLSFYLFGYLLEINSANLEQAFFWNQIQYLGLPFFPVLWSILALLYTKRIDSLRRWISILLFIIPTLTFFIRLTNPLHHLYYISYKFEKIFEISLLRLEKGPWYYVQSTHIGFSLLITTIVLYGEYRKGINFERPRFRILLAASIIPYAGLIFILLDFMGLSIDYSALLMPVSVFLVMFAIFKYDFLGVKTMAHDNIFDNSSDAMILMDMEYRIIDFNKAAQYFFSIFNISLRNIGIEDVIVNQKELIGVFKSESSQDFQLKNGEEERFFEINSTYMQNSFGRNVGILKCIRDITEKKKIQEKLEILAIVDELSGLYNRRQFMELAQKEFEQARLLNQAFSVLMIDIDRFKSINDTKGHGAGDAVIREFGRLVNATFRKTDIFGRLGGEEFAIILVNTSIDDARLAAEKFREVVANTKVLYEDIYINLTISIGVASFFSEAKDIEEIMRCADQALYESKARGRNLVTLRQGV